TLNQILSRHNLEYSIVDKNIILNRATPPTPQVIETMEVQQQAISGRILNEKSEILANVTVREKNTDNVSMSDAFGNYTLKVTGSNSTIVFSIVGYQKQEVIADKNTIDITMLPELSDIDEVVVVGYGEQKKVNLTGAVSQISGEEFEDRPVT